MADNGGNININLALNGLKTVLEGLAEIRNMLDELRKTSLNMNINVPKVKMPDLSKVTVKQTTNLKTDTLNILANKAQAISNTLKILSQEVEIKAPNIKLKTPKIPLDGSGGNGGGNGSEFDFSGMFYKFFSSIPTKILASLAAKTISSTTKMFANVATFIPKTVVNNIKGFYETISQLTGASQITSVAGFTNGIVSLGKAVRDLNSESLKTSISVEQLSKYRLVMQNAGMEEEEFGNRVSYMGKQITKAFAGTAPDAERVLRKLNLTEKDLLTVPVEERFQKVAIAIAGMRDESEKAHAAMLLFERSGNILLPIFGNMKERIEEAEKVLGNLPTLLDKNKEKFTQFTNGIQNLAIKRQQVFAGFFDNVGDSINKLLSEINKVDFSFLGNTIAGYFKETKAVIDNGDYKKLFGTFTSELTVVVGDAFTNGIKFVNDNITGEAFGKIADTIAETIGKAIENTLPSAIKGTWMFGIGFFSEYFYNHFENRKKYDIDKTSAMFSNTEEGQKQFKYFFPEIYDEKEKIERIKAAEEATAKLNEEARKNAEIIRTQASNAKEFVNSYISTQQVDLAKEYNKDLLLVKSTISQIVSAESGIDKDWTKNLSDKTSERLQLSFQREAQYAKMAIDSYMSSESVQSGFASNLTEYIKKQIESGGIDKAIANKIKDIDSITDVNEKDKQRTALFDELEQSNQGGILTYKNKIKNEYLDAINQILNEQDLQKSISALQELVSRDSKEYANIERAIIERSNASSQSYTLSHEELFAGGKEALADLTIAAQKYNDELSIIGQSGAFSDTEKLNQSYGVQKSLLANLYDQYEQLLELYNQASYTGDVEKIKTYDRALSQLNVTIHQTKNALNDIDFNTVTAQISKIKQDVNSAGIKQSLYSLQGQNTLGRLDSRGGKNTDEYNQSIKDQIALLNDAFSEIDFTLSNADIFNLTKEQISSLSDEKIQLSIDIETLKDQFDTSRSFVFEFIDTFEEMEDSFKTTAESMGDMMSECIEGWNDDMSDFLYDTLTGAEEGKAALSGMWTNMWKTAMRAISNTISNFVMSKSVMLAVEQTFNMAMLGLNKIFNGSLLAQEEVAALEETAIWSGPALMKSIVSFGAAVVIGIAAMAAVMALTGSFAEGGLIAGGEQFIRVNENGQESVINAEGTRNNMEYIKLMNQGEKMDDIIASQREVTNIPNNDYSKLNTFIESRRQSSPEEKTVAYVQTPSDIRRLCKESGVIELVKEDLVRNKLIKKG